MRTEDLQTIGLTDEQIKKVFELSGKDVNAEKKKTEKAEAERDQWKEKAEAAEETLKGFDGVDVDGMKTQIEEWKEKAQAAEKDYQKQLYDRDFNDALKDAMDQYKFSSEAARSAIMAEVRGAELKLKDGKILGLGDLMEMIKARDASAFQTDGGGAKFTDNPKGQGGNNLGFDKMSLVEKMKFANEHPGNAEVQNWLKH